MKMIEKKKKIFCDFLDRIESEKAAELDNDTSKAKSLHKLNELYINLLYTQGVPTGRALYNLAIECYFRD